MEGRVFNGTRIFYIFTIINGIVFSLDTGISCGFLVYRYFGLFFKGNREILHNFQRYTHYTGMNGLPLQTQVKSKVIEILAFK